ncbi:MAG: hypothetical protein HY313_11080, partial [Acidobacteria bacterium]|nr:hypothetical protein [Acidobacteriota bacterium]
GLEVDELLKVFGNLDLGGKIIMASDIELERIAAGLLQILGSVNIAANLHAYGTITCDTPVNVPSGGTNASDAYNARVNLGCATASQQTSSVPDHYHSFT